MNELRNSKSDDQLEELLLLTEQMQEELDQKDRTIRELKVQLDESLTLNEKLNSENKTENIQALKNDLRKTKELLQSEKEKTHTVQAMIEECRDKQRQAEQERDYALSHQKKVEIPVEKPVLYQKCGNCKQTAYLKAKEKYDMQREKLAGRYKTKTAMYEALMFLLIWYSVSTTLFQMIRSKIFISDCVVYRATPARARPTLPCVLRRLAPTESLYPVWRPLSLSTSSSVCISARPQKKRWRTKSSVCSVRKSAKCDFFLNLMKKSLTFRLWQDLKVDSGELRRTSCSLRY